MYTTSHSHRLRRDRAHGAAARKRASTSLLCFLGAILILASSLHTLLPKVDGKAVADGDTITVYVDTADPCESGNVPREVQEAAAERTKARAAKNYQKADTLQKIIVDAGYRQVPNLAGEQVLAKKYRIRLRGVDAPENSMPYGKEAKEELVRLVQGRTLKISVYDTDWYGRLVGDVDCNGVFVQEYMLKKGLSWHYAAYDRRPELAEVSVGEAGAGERVGPVGAAEFREAMGMEEEGEADEKMANHSRLITKKTLFDSLSSDL